jgi:hypothetical protein
MLVTMKRLETEREVYIKIKDDPAEEPDEIFKIQILDELTREKLIGIDSETSVTILDNDKVGTFGFENTHLIVDPHEDSLKVKIVRTEGANGEVNCEVRTTLNTPRLDEYDLAKPGVDFQEITSMQIDFGDCQNEAFFTVLLPDSSLKN